MVFTYVKLVMTVSDQIYRKTEIIRCCKNDTIGVIGLWCSRLCQRQQSCFVMLSSLPERFPAVNGRLSLQRSIWPDPSYTRGGSTARKMTRDSNTPITYKPEQFDTFFFLEMDERLCSIKDCEIFSYALGKKPKFFWLFSRCNWGDNS